MNYYIEIITLSSKTYNFILLGFSSHAEMMLLVDEDRECYTGVNIFAYKLILMVKIKCCMVIHISELSTVLEISEEVNETLKWKPEPSKRTNTIECQLIYSVKIIWCWEHFKKKTVGKTCFVIVRGEELHVDVYTNVDLTRLLGCFPIHWFEYFDLVDYEAEIEKIEIASDQVNEEDMFDQPVELGFFEQVKYSNNYGVYKFRKKGNDETVKI